MAELLTSHISICSAGTLPGSGKQRKMTFPCKQTGSNNSDNGGKGGFPNKKKGRQLKRGAGLGVGDRSLLLPRLKEEKPLNFKEKGGVQKVVCIGTCNFYLAKVIPLLRRENNGR